MKHLKVGDLVRVVAWTTHQPVGGIVDRIEDERTDYFAWRVFTVDRQGDGQNLPFHQRWLEPVDIVGEKK